jgi:hypothetical protein
MNFLIIQGALIRIDVIWIIFIFLVSSQQKILNIPHKNFYRSIPYKLLSILIDKKTNINFKFKLNKESCLNISKFIN